MADYTELTDRDATRILRSGGRSLQELEPLKGGAANSSFLARIVDAAPVVITVLDNHDIHSARALVQLTDWLLRHEVHTPEVLANASGDRVMSLGDRPVVVRPFVAGSQPGALTEDQAFAVGEAMAGYHGVEPPSDMPLPGRRLPTDWLESISPGAPPDLVRLVLESEADLLDHVGDDRSLIHGDLFPDNMIWSESGRLSILDWETAAIDWPALDLGFTMVGLAGDSIPDGTLTAAMLRGYGVGGGTVPEPDALRAAAHYACAVLMFHRYRRHVVRYPDPARTDFWRRLLPFMEATAAHAGSR